MIKFKFPVYSRIHIYIYIYIITCQGFNVYRYMGRVIQPGYPKPIDSLFPGIPHDLDSIFQVTNRLIARKGY